MTSTTTGRAPCALLRRRSTLPLRGTVAQREAKLDHDSDVALSFAKLWHARAGSVSVPSGGIVRRALQVYVRHLDNVADQATEVRAVERACKASRVDEEARQETQERLQAAEVAEVLPPFRDVVRDPAEAARILAAAERSQDLAEELLRGSGFRFHQS